MRIETLIRFVEVPSVTEQVQKFDVYVGPWYLGFMYTHQSGGVSFFGESPETTGKTGTAATLLHDYDSRESFIRGLCNADYRAEGY